jgi:hypothetical protein
VLRLLADYTEETGEVYTAANLVAYYDSDFAESMEEIRDFNPKFYERYSEEFKGD